MDTLIELFKNIVYMSSIASIVILIVLALRILLKNAPKKLTYTLWLIVALRLIIPDMISTDFSIFNLFETTEIINTDQDINIHELNTSVCDNIQSGTISQNNVSNSESKIELENTIKNETVTKKFTVNNDNKESVVQDTFSINFIGHIINLPNYSSFIWLIGIGVFLIYFVCSYIFMAHKLRFSTFAYDYGSKVKTFYCENISSPFVFGIINPKIYIPYGLTGTSFELILQHEKYHIHKKDHLIKAFAFLLLSIYWFCPFVWIAYYFFQKDMELRCDEAVLARADLETRKCYTNTLLAFASNNRKYLFSPVAFGENSTKERVKFSLKSHKFSLIVTIISIITIIIVGVVCLTDNKKNSVKETESTKTYTLQYGVYNYKSDVDSIIDSPSISVTKDSIYYSESPVMSMIHIYNEYYIENNIVYAKNQYDTLEFEIIDNDTIKLNNKLLDFEIQNESNYNDATEDLAENIDIADGIYANDSGFQIEIRNGLLHYGNIWESHSPIKYDYHIDNNIIFAQSENESLEIVIVNQSKLKYNDMFFVYDIYSAIDTSAYIAALSNDDIESAIETAYDYYSSSVVFEEIISINMSNYTYYWYTAIDGTDLTPGSVIVLESEVVWGGNVYPGPRWMTLYKDSENNNTWTVVNEGK